MIPDAKDWTLVLLRVLIFSLFLLNASGDREIDRALPVITCPSGKLMISTV